MDIATCELMATKIMGWQNAKNNHWNNHKMVMVMMEQTTRRMEMVII
jgi:hypothetical protein